MSLLKYTIAILLLFFNTAIYSYAQKKAISCIIKGQIFGRDSSKALLLFKSSADFRFIEGSRIRIPIMNNHFEDTFTVTDIEMYNLVFEDELEKGAFDAILFFPYNGTINFALYPQRESVRNQVCGGDLNREYYHQYLYPYNATFDKRLNALRKLRDDLRANNDYLSPEWTALSKQRRNTKDQDSSQQILSKMQALQENKLDLTKNAYLLKLRFDTLSEDQARWRYNYIKRHITIPSYYLLLTDMRFNDNNKIVREKSIEVASAFTSAFPKHPYTEIVNNKLKSMALKKGEKFRDLSLPDFDGNIHNISNVIKGKIAVIDFWGSWCAPCIYKTKQIAPLFNDYEAKGFTIVGVAREFKSNKAAKNRIDKENWSWLHLIELDDKNNIWRKYGIGEGGGTLMLIDKEGKIISTDAKPEEVKAFLEKELGKG